ncbi:MAG TPA: hypothetical protein VH189_04050, partial [Rhizomicrobium sp.]|nr:hypothetical protein [Rhizomicrobium sp.]
KALRKLRVVTAIAILAHIARSDVKFGLGAFLPALLRRAGRKLFSEPQPGQDSQAFLSLSARASSEAGF